MVRQIEESGSCATCRKRLTKEDYMHLPRENRFDVCLDSADFTRSTKMVALMEHLKSMK
jgi:ferredoxin